MSLNIRFANSGDGEDNWEYRCDDILETIRRYHPAFLGVQEALAHQVGFIDDALPTHGFVGIGRDDGVAGGEFSAIFFDTSQFTCMWHQTFWLSETPDTPSFGWGAAYRRICTYGLFQHKQSTNMLFVFNTHFDHEVIAARLNSSRLILEKIVQLRSEDPLPIILMGDFNATSDEETIHVLTQELVDAAEISETPLRGLPGTFNGFRIGTKPERRIDYIFVKGLRVEHYVHADDKTTEGRWISDHLPVVATVVYH